MPIIALHVYLLRVWIMYQATQHVSSIPVYNNRHLDPYRPVIVRVSGGECTPAFTTECRTRVFHTPPPLRYSPVLVRQQLGSCLPVRYGLRTVFDQTNVAK